MPAFKHNFVDKIQGISPDFGFVFLYLSDKAFQWNIL